MDEFDPKEELQNALYERMEQEFKTLSEQLEASTPKQVMENSYQLVIKQDLLMLMEEGYFTMSQLKTMSEMELPLDALYQNWLNVDITYMDRLKESVEELTDSIMRVRAEQKYADPNTPPYTLGSVSASERGEMFEWRVSYQYDRDCRRYYQEGIRDVYHTEQNMPFLQGWVEKFGLDRCVRLLCYAVSSGKDDTLYDRKVLDRASYFRFPDGDRISDLKPRGIHKEIVNDSLHGLMALEQARGNTFTIYQLKRGAEMHDLRFEPLDRLKATGHSVSAANYQRVYTGLLDPATTPETLFEKFNISRPADFYGHSMSVSDVVALRRDGVERALYCDSFGFAELPDFKGTEAQQELPAKPKRRGSQER